MEHFIPNIVLSGRGARGLRQSHKGRRAAGRRKARQTSTRTAKAKQHFLTMASETTPLVSKRGPSSESLPSNSGAGAGPATAYFLGGAHHRHTSSGFDSIATPTGQAEVDAPPAGAAATEFDSRPVLTRDPPPPAWKGKFAQGKKGDASMDADAAGGVGTLVLPRKVPLKLEPKVHFANERTFLAWLNVILVPAAASLAIVAYSTGDNLVDQFYGIVLLPVSTAYMFYALWQCKSPRNAFVNLIRFLILI